MSNTDSNLKSLVEDSAQDIWNEAVNSVKANNNANPDDSLYTRQEIKWK
jgi:hypothetical protein